MNACALAAWLRSAVKAKIVEADETYFGKTDQPRISPARRGRPYNPRGSRGPKDKRPIVALVERGGSVRTFHVPVADKATVGKIVADNIAREPRLHTDESRLYPEIGQLFTTHETVKHSVGEYVRDDAHTNSAEGYFSIFKRGMRGVYQHCAEKHLHRYLSEFDFRYNHRTALGYNDGDRAALAIKGCGWQASHVSKCSQGRTLNLRQRGSCAGERNDASGSLAFSARLPFCFRTLARNILHRPWWRYKCSAQRCVEAILCFLYTVIFISFGHYAMTS